MTIRKIYSLFRILLLSTMFSCSPAIAQYSEFANEITSAVKEGDREALILISERITDKHLLEEGGLRYLKLKMTALTFAGDYQNAFVVIDEYVGNFPGNYELLMGQGIIADRIGIDDFDFFTNAYIILKEKSISSKTESELVMEYYLAALLNLKDLNYIQTELLPNLSSDGLIITKHYDSFNKEELLMKPPLGFIATVPFFIVNGSENKEWWK